MSTKLAQALRLMDEAYCDVGPRMDKLKGRQALMRSREALAEYDASQSIPADAVEVASDAYAEFALEGVDMTAMQAALAAAFPALTQQVEQAGRQLDESSELLQQAEAKLNTLSADNARLLNVLAECRKQVATAPHSWGYEFTLLPLLDAAQAKQAEGG